MASIWIPTGESIRRLRKRAGLTQKDLAERAGVSQSLISRIERGSVDPKLSTLQSILNVLSGYTSVKKRACDIMNPNVISVRYDETVRDAVDLMRTYDISQLPVEREGRMVGGIHEASLIRMLVFEKNPREFFEQKVFKVMEKPFPTVSPDTLLEEVMLILSRGEPAVIVEEDGRMVGIITKIDVISSFLKDMGEEK
ncbi:MAG: CBS domain-containing protein [Nitrososphaerota archaeon]|nr:CBS domain-containing protein [Candidatus Bathyarchaeota archaeon]MCX8161885.1 CBS domain-containing protein [Candidatus Bathyarchaeota archaeon]MDW8061224.1 CBS domain-containing protein [Nitrososphaerota archaeon]